MQNQNPEFSSSVGRSGSAMASARQHMQRPGLKFRAYSVPVSSVPTSHLTDAGASSDEDDITSQHTFGTVPEDDDELSNDLDIAADPFFQQQCNFMSSSIVTETTPSSSPQVTHCFPIPPQSSEALQTTTYSSASTDADDTLPLPVQRNRPTPSENLDLECAWACESTDSLASRSTDNGPMGNTHSNPGYTDYRPESSDGRISPKTRGPIPATFRPDSRTDPHPYTSSLYPVMSEAFHSSRDINIVVIGEKGVGKSTYIQRSFGMRNFSNSAAAIKEKVIDDQAYNVRLIELDMSKHELDPHNQIMWPDMIDGAPMPPIHGALVIYNVMSKESLEEIPELLTAFHKSGIQFMLISSKCDCHPALREIDPELVRLRAQDLLKVHVLSHSTAISSPHTYGKSLDVLVKVIASSRLGFYQHPIVETTSIQTGSSSRRRANSTASSLYPPQFSTNKHTRATSDCSVSQLRERATTPTTPSGPSQLLLREQTFLNLEDSPSRESISSLPRSMEPQPTIGLEIFNEGDANFGSAAVADSSGGTSLAKGNLQASFKQTLRPDPTFDELVDHLLDLPLGRNDEKFRFIFLCLYRFFAAPYTLLDAILTRFDSLDKGSDSSAGSLDIDSSHLLRSISQQRYISVLQTWLSRFPGDFAHPLTKQRLAGFLQRLSDPNTDLGCFHMVAAQMLLSDLDSVAEDDDTDWLSSDRQLIALKTAELSGAGQERLNLSFDQGKLNYQFDSYSLDGVSRQVSSMSLASTDSTKYTQSSSHTDQRKASTFSAASQKSFTGTLNSMMDSRTNFQFMLPFHVPRFNLNKSHWNTFMNTPDEIVAQEFTAIDWQLFSFFKPRDIIRHISMSDEERSIIRAMRRSLTSSSQGYMRPISVSTPMSSSWMMHQGLLAVDLLTTHFNHVALIASNLVLLRGKVRNRVAAITKLMRVARCLRNQNNYHSLGAILAGLNSTSVHRLTQTKDLIPQDISRDFMKLEILMSPSRSYTAYRLAWDNSDKGRIPYLPIHRRDLVAGIEGSKSWADEMSTFKPEADSPTDCDDVEGMKEAYGSAPGVPGQRRINWRKYSMLGEIVTSLESAKQSPCPGYHEGSVNEEMRSIILESSIVAEDELHKRSWELEPNPNGPGSGLGSISLGLSGLGFGSLNNGTGPVPVSNPTTGQGSISTPGGVSATSQGKKFNWFR